ncbi:MAG TPA: isoprenylcysteine carboxylmethyltransferase family protein [Nitrospirae bacterium]|nr:isoprenylcysteine carboxylmethyltransferase family protein [Nitrospirota bacterium]
MQAVLQITGVFLLFAFVHSLCVRERVKRWFAQVAGGRTTRGLYRLLYTIFSAVTTLAVLLYILGLPDYYIFRGPAWFRWSMHLVQFSGLLLAASSFRTIDVYEFMGIRQFLKFIKGKEIGGDLEGITINRLITTGAFSVVRHPMYLGGLIIFTFEPNITRNWLTVTVLADLYFIYGAIAEEKRLKKHFGKEYEEYMKRVPRFVPRLKGLMEYLKLQD